MVSGFQRAEQQGLALTASMTRIKMNFNEKKARANKGPGRANKGKEK